MAQIKFDDNQVNQGKKLLEFHDNMKFAKAYSDAGQVINGYNQSGTYIQSYAKHLNERLRKDFPEIDILDTISLNLLLLPRSPFELKLLEVTRPVEIRNLQFDQFGILFSVLHKQNPYLKEKDFMLGLI